MTQEHIDTVVACTCWLPLKEVGRPAKNDYGYPSAQNVTNEAKKLCHIEMAFSIMCSSPVLIVQGSFKSGCLLMLVIHQALWCQS